MRMQTSLWQRVKLRRNYVTWIRMIRVWNDDCFLLTLQVVRFIKSKRWNRLFLTSPQIPSQSCICYTCTSGRTKTYKAMPFEVYCKVEMICKFSLYYLPYKPTICLEICYYFSLFISAQIFALDKEHILRQETILF